MAAGATFDEPRSDGAFGIYVADAIVRIEDGVQTTAFEVVGDRIVALYTVCNPDKLRHFVS